MNVIAGLGNPGLEYERTPHNVGFRAVDELASRLGASWHREPRFKADVAKASAPSGALLLVKPTTFMNLSGDSVSPILSFYKVPAANFIAVLDEVNLDPGRIRIRPDGSAGGHNGLKSLVERLGTRSFARVRIGVGMGHHPVQDLAARVLGKIDPEDEASTEEGVQKAASAALDIVEHGVDFAMNKYNGPETVGSAS